MKNKTSEFHELKDIYNDVETSIRGIDGQCNACGKCCDFENFDHTLYLTPIEAKYMLGNISLPLNSLTNCPYAKDGKCIEREYRCLGCRIFHCNLKGENAVKMNDIYNEGLVRIRKLCKKYNYDTASAPLATYLEQKDLEQKDLEQKNFEEIK